ncbi:MAG: hypothetical protein JWN25_831, partial [Verrucomicrobiales bacterium]|nr:hypothetical protein [Verrucomicrobiales bacterium]
MKQMGKVKKGLVLGLVACCLSLFTSVQAETPILGTATVRAIHGTAKYKSPDGTWLPLKVGKNLTQGDTISTSTDTTLDLFLRQNGPVLRVMADTTLGLNILNFTDSTGERVVNTQLGLTAGRILGNVK